MVTISDALVFTAFQVCSIGIGCLVCAHVFGERDYSIVSAAHFTPLIISLCVIASWLAQLAGSHLPFFAAGLGLLIYLPRNATRLTTRQLEPHQKLGFLITGVAALSFYYVQTAIPMRMPTNASPGLFYQDTLYNLGNTWSLIRFEPTADTRVEGGELVYHLGQSLYHFFIHSLTGIHPFFIQNYLAAAFGIYVICAFCTIGQQSVSHQKTGVTFLLLLFFCATQNYNSSGYIGHIFFEQVTFFFSLIILVAFLYHLVQDEGFNFSQGVYGILLCICLMMSKAIFLVIAPVMLIICLILNHQKYNTQSLWALLILNLASVVAVKFSMYPSSPRTEWHILIPDGIKLSNILSLLTTNLHAVSSRFFGYLTDNFQADYPVFLGGTLVALAYWQLIRGRDPSKAFRLTIIALFAILMILQICIINFKHNYVYGIWYSRIIILFLIAYSVGSIESANMRKVSYLIFSVILVFGLKYNYQIQQAWNESPWHGNVRKGGTIWDPRASVDQGEWDAMVWIQKNTRKDALILSDRTHFTSESGKYGLSRFFGYSALSGRQFFLEGYEFSKSIPMSVRENRKIEVVEAYSAGEEGIKALMKLRKIDYAVVSKRFSEAIELKELDLVFSNKSIDIIRARDSE